MDNRDFRDRLKAHKVEPSMPAWEQMEGMLDALPKEENKSKKRFLWWPFLLLGVLVSVTLITFNNSSKSNDSFSSNSNTELSTTPTMTDDKTVEAEGNNQLDSALQKSDERIAIGNIVKINDRNTTNTVSESLENEVIIKQARTAKVKPPTENVNLRSSGEALSGNTIKAVTITENISIEEEPYSELAASPSQLANVTKTKSNDGIESTNYRNQNTELGENENTPTLISGSKNQGATKSTDPSSTQIETNDNAPFAKQAETISSLEEVSSAEDKSIAEADKEDLTTLEIERSINLLDYLNRDFQDLTYADYEMGESKIIRNIGPSRFYWLAGVGYAEFNNNPGMIFTGGVMYDVDRIIDLELNTSYTFGRGSEEIGTDSITKEQQIELNLMVHLNFIKNKKHKISFDLGGGLTSYSGQRLIQSAEPSLNIRSSFGRNLQMGLSYHYSLNRNSKLGLRLGVVAYDDAIIYISSRFVQRF